MIQQLKYYSVAFFNALLLAIPFTDLVDTGIKIISLLSGIVLLIYTVKKFRIDISSRRIEYSIKKLRMEQEQQKLYQLLEQNKNTNRRPRKK